MQTINDITGPEAGLYWGWHRAGTLRGWTVVSGSDGHALTGTLVDSVDFMVSQRPLEVVTPNGWRWVIEPETLQIANGTLTARIRSKESPDAALSDRPA